MQYFFSSSILRFSESSRAVFLALSAECMSRLASVEASLSSGQIFKDPGKELVLDDLARAAD